jgi:hypothetical protein
VRGEIQVKKTSRSRKTKDKPVVIPQHISFSFTCRFDMEEVTRLLTVQQTQALFRGLAQVLSSHPKA